MIRWYTSQRQFYIRKPANVKHLAMIGQPTASKNKPPLSSTIPHQLKRKSQSYLYNFTQSLITLASSSENYIHPLTHFRERHFLELLYLIFCEFGIGFGLSMPTHLIHKPKFIHFTRRSRLGSEKWKWHALLFHKVMEIRGEWGRRHNIW